MTIGILVTGEPPKSLEPRFGDYIDMFEGLIGRDLDYATFDVAGGELPASASVCEGYLVTGSAAGAYDDLAWIPPLEDFLRAAKGKARLVGVCFGHQLMAQAFGGKVVKSPKGWGVGLHRYAIGEGEAWMDAPAPIAVPVSHQDQVVALPPGARAIGGNAFTPMGVIAYGDQPAISMQCHPEFSADFAKALLETRWSAKVLGDEAAREAIASLNAPNDNRRVGGWIRRFLTGA